VHLPYKIWADTVNTERHQFVDVKLSPELRVDSFHELRVGAVNAHGNQLIGRNVFADMLANLADETYEKIGDFLMDCAKDYVTGWEKSRKG